MEQKKEEAEARLKELKSQHHKRDHSEGDTHSSCEEDFDDQGKYHQSGRPLLSTKIISSS